MAIDFETILSSPDATYDEGLKFFRGGGVLNQAVQKLAADLDRENIDYAAIGAIALNRYGYRRFTEDIDLLLTKEGLETFRQSLIGRGYRPAFESARKKFRTSDNIPIEIITTGEYPGDGLEKPVAFPDPSECSIVIDGLKTITLERLIELKLASGMTAPHRLKDLADVQELIRIKHLDREFAERLNDYVRDRYIDLWHAVASAPEDAEN